MIIQITHLLLCENSHNINKSSNMLETDIIYDDVSNLLLQIQWTLCVLK